MNSQQLPDRISLALGDSAVSHLLDHVANVVWAKEVFKKAPRYTVEYLLAEAKALTVTRFMPYDERVDD